jgi:hypothetical protein
MIKPNLTPTQQLERARSLVPMGEIHEATALNLRYWPFAVDPEIRAGNSECKVEFGVRCEHQADSDTPSIPASQCHRCGHVISRKQVEYSWTIPDRAASWKPTGHYKTRLKELERCVKLALGQEFSLFVFVNQARIFPFETTRGTPKKPNRSRKPAARKRPKSRKTGRTRR